MRERQRTVAAGVSKTAPAAGRRAENTSGPLSLNLARFLSWLRTIRANPTFYPYGKAGW